MNPKEGERGRKPAELLALYCDMSKAKRVLGYTPKIKLEEGLQKQIKWYQNNPDRWN